MGWLSGWALCALWDVAQSLSEAGQYLEPKNPARQRPHAARRQVIDVGRSPRRLQRGTIVQGRKGAICLPQANGPQTPRPYPPLIGPKAPTPAPAGLAHNPTARRSPRAVHGWPHILPGTRRFFIAAN